MKEADKEVKWFYTDFLPKTRTARSVKIEDGILPRLRKENVKFFTPWGPRYCWKKRGSIIQDFDKEIITLKYLREISYQLSSNMPNKNIQWIFLGADLYGSRINGMPADIISNYFESLFERLNSIIPESEFHLWSEFDLKAQQYRQEVINNRRFYIDEDLFRRAKQTAVFIGQNNNPETYIIERIAEAMLVEELWQPIKISCVQRHKDDKVDMDLPRLYLLPKEITAPWM